MRALISVLLRTSTEVSSFYSFQVGSPWAGWAYRCGL